MSCSNYTFSRGDRVRHARRKRETGSVLDIDTLSDLVLVAFDSEARPALVSSDKLVPLKDQP